MDPIRLRRQVSTPIRSGRIVFADNLPEYVEIPFPQTLEEYDALLRDKRFLHAPQVGEDIWRRLYETFKGPTDYDFIKWIPAQSQKMNVAIHQQKQKAIQVKPVSQPLTQKQLYQKRVEQEAKKRISEQRFEAAVQRKIQELTPAGSSFK